MDVVKGAGNFIDGRFIQSGDLPLVSKNPSANYEKVFESKYSLEAIAEAADAAQRAYPAWAKLPQSKRNKALLKLKDVFIKHENVMAEAISLEMGKIISESQVEAKSLSARIDLMISLGIARVQKEKPEGVSGEVRYHSQGPLTVIGPYNFPAHLVNAHVIPALLCGNTVVVKPSEICPYVGELYARCFEEAGLPPGVFNMVQGKGDVGQELCRNPIFYGLLFTGSYKTGRIIRESLLDQPHKIVALELGGKNFSVVMNDAHLEQALAEIVQGAFLTTGQRCTATSRVLIQRGLFDELTAKIQQVTGNLKPGDPFDASSPFGPLASAQAKTSFLSQSKTASLSGCETLIQPTELPGGAFVTPGLYTRNDTSLAASDFLTEELFGPSLCLEPFDRLQDAMLLVNESPYGLSNSLFSRNPEHFETFYYGTRSGVLNFNKSTNGASGQMPFGGVGKSGNFRAAGIDAPRYTTYPVAINFQDYGRYTLSAGIAPHMKNI